MQAKNLLPSLALLKNLSVAMEIVSHCIMSVIIMTTVETILMSSAAVSIVVVAWTILWVFFFLAGFLIRSEVGTSCFRVIENCGEIH